jgi:hypothetical protein
VFGVSLEELHQKDPSRTVPRIVERLVEYLEQHQVYETEGIFRKSGRNLSIDALRKEFDFAGQGREDEVGLSEEEDESIGIHEVAGTLKLFLQMLPEPPLSYELYPSYIALQGISISSFYYYYYYYLNNFLILCAQTRLRV